MSFPVRFLRHVFRIFAFVCLAIIASVDLHPVFGVVIGISAFCELLVFVVNDPRKHNPISNAVI